MKHHLWTCGGLQGLALLLSLGLLGCIADKPTPSAGAPEEPTGPAWFEDVTDAVGLDFVQDAGPTDTFFMPQMMGSGGAFIHDGDGTLYLYLLNNAGPDSPSVNRLYTWLPSSKFEDA